MEKRYNPKQAEKKWEEFWEKEGYFNPRPGQRGESFSMVMPPPNITGVLHMGHAFNLTLQDIVARFKRMQGYEVLWVPGIDHAGIATQNVVERQLQEEGFTREDLGREEFIRRVWKWKQQYGNRIFNQMKKMGISCSWEDKAFTMDKAHSDAVKHVFVTLYEEGYIYRGDYIINWCPRCQTALSDIEVEYEEIQGKLYYIRYPFVDRKEGGYLVVATTRPETMLGDTAVAVNPDDERYKRLGKKRLILPLVGRELPLIFDEYVDPDFGTGALKITPAHDPEDFAIGKKHGLPLINIFNKDGTVNKEGGSFEGLDRYECRDAVVEKLEKQGYLEKVEDYTYRLGRCYRCDSPVEPYLSPQWFVKMKDLAEEAINVVREEKINFYPAYWKKSYFDWLERIHDWCISRQIWWGHRLPVWYCNECGEVIVSREEPTGCTSCNSTGLKQEEDVLDTWFSSGLWPFTTLGWPEEGEKFKKFYPTSVLCSSWDILFFWIARMIMMGLKFTGKVPFYKVHIHPLIGDEKGEKMSKSRGNVIDPLQVMEKFGTDAFRFSLIALKTETPYLRFSQERVRGYRNFANKVWNASRFVLMNLEGFSPSEAGENVKPEDFELSDRWILSRYEKVIVEVTEYLDDFQFPQAAHVLYQFIWTDFCDWYVELVKSRLRKESPSRQVAQLILYAVLKGTLKLLHPFMPFLTEDIFQRLPEIEESIMIANWPAREGREDSQAEEKMGLLTEVITEIRTIRSEMRISPQKRIEVLLRSTNCEHLRLLKEHSSYIEDLAHTDKLTIGADIEKPKVCASGIVKDVDIFVPLARVIKVEKEKERLQKELGNIREELSRSKRKLSSTQFLQKAPGEVVEKERRKKEEFEEKLKKIQGRLKDIV